jgi:hypothetical protein
VTGRWRYSTEAVSMHCAQEVTHDVIANPAGS